MWKYVVTSVGTLLVITVGIGGFYLFMQVSQLGADLEETRDDLGQADSQIRLLRDDLQEKEDAYTGLLTSYRELQDSGAELLAQHKTLVSDSIALEEENLRLLEVVAPLEDAQSELQRIQGLATEAEEAHDTWRAGVSRMQDLFEDLDAEVTELEERRRPLLLHGNTSTTDFLCTGSMEPKITCLDTMTWLTDFDPADITVGTIIVYSPSCWGAPYQIAHRVTQIEGAEGVYAFRTKADAEDSDDGCWIPHERVQGYLIDIQKNTRMGNAWLREQVNNARDLHLRLEARYISTGEDYALYLEAHRSWSCWVESAGQSTGEGHVPFTC